MNGEEGHGNRIIPTGDVPSPVNPPSGCVFHPRCHRATHECSTTHPDLHAVGDGESRCLYAEEIYAENDAN